MNVSIPPTNSTFENHRRREPGWAILIPVALQSHAYLKGHAFPGTPTADKQQNQATTWQVKDVVPNDHLNVRRWPSADTAIVGILPPGTSGIIVRGCTAAKGKGSALWCEVEYGRMRGWSKARFLEPEHQ